MGTLHCAQENGANLYVNECQKIRHYRARTAEERRRMKKKKEEEEEEERRRRRKKKKKKEEEEECQIAIFLLCAVRT